MDGNAKEFHDLLETCGDPNLIEAAKNLSPEQMKQFFKTHESAINEALSKHIKSTLGTLGDQVPASVKNLVAENIMKQTRDGKAPDIRSAISLATIAMNSTAEVVKLHKAVDDLTILLKRQAENAVELKKQTENALAAAASGHQETVLTHINKANALAAQNEIALSSVEEARSEAVLQLKVLTTWLGDMTTLVSVVSQAATEEQRAVKIEVDKLNEQVLTLGTVQEGS